MRTLVLERAVGLAFRPGSGVLPGVHAVAMGKCRLAFIVAPGHPTPLQPEIEHLIELVRRNEGQVPPGQEAAAWGGARQRIDSQYTAA